MRVLVLAILIALVAPFTADGQHRTAPSADHIWFTNLVCTNEAVARQLGDGFEAGVYYPDARNPTMRRLADARTTAYLNFYEQALQAHYCYLLPSFFQTRGVVAETMARWTRRTVQVTLARLTFQSSDHKSQVVLYTFFDGTES